MPKIIKSIIWNPNGFHLIFVRPDVCAFNGNSHSKEMLVPFSELQYQQSGGVG
jgi:hypothetical protein